MKKMLIVLLVSFSAQSFGAETIELYSDQDEETALIEANQSYLSRLGKRASYSVSPRVKRNLGVAFCAIGILTAIVGGATLSMIELREYEATNQEP